MPGAIHPYTVAEIREAESWLAYVQAALDAATADPGPAIVEAIDKAQRRAGLSEGAAALLAEIFDVSEIAESALA